MGTWYVKTDGNNANDGSSLALANQTIHAMVNALALGVHTINVVAGTYSEGTGLSFANGQDGEQITIRATSGTQDVTITSSGVSTTFLSKARWMVDRSRWKTSSSTTPN